MEETALDHAFEAVPRADFLPTASHGSAHLDEPVQLWSGQTNSQPTTVARMLALLDPSRGNRVLDVGSGSGWTTALLAHLVGPTGSVHGVEVLEDLARWGAENLARWVRDSREVADGENLPSSEREDLPSSQHENLTSSQMQWAQVHQAMPGVLGWPAAAPFDRILVSAGAEEVPPELTDQLAEGGRMVLPVRGTMTVVDLRQGTTQVWHAPGAYRFVPLIRSPSGG